MKSFCCGDQHLDQNFEQKTSLFANLSQLFIVGRMGLNMANAWSIFVAPVEEGALPSGGPVEYRVREQKMSGFHVLLKRSARSGRYYDVSATSVESPEICSIVDVSWHNVVFSAVTSEKNDFDSVNCS